MSPFLLTATDAWNASARAAGWLRDGGVRPGHLVALIGPSPDLPASRAASVQGALTAVVLGALRAGSLPVLVHPALTPSEQQRLTASLPIQRSFRDEQIIDLTAPRPITARTPELSDVPLGRPMHFTSGTSGLSKGVWAGSFDPAQAAAFWADEARQWAMTPDDLILTHGSLAHSAPLRFALLAALAGATTAFTGSFDAQRVAAATAELRPSVAMAVPIHLQRVLDVPGGPPSSAYRMLVHAGSPCAPALKARIHQWAGAENVWEFLGATEGQFTACRGTEADSRPGTVGRARPGRRLSIEPDHPGSSRGTIWCHAPEGADFAYFQDPEKTARAWRTGPQGPEFTVGDVGELDADGYLYLRGRRDDLIITGGVNVYPAEVEDLLAHCPFVADVAVVGLPDEQWGQRVCAAVVLRPGADLDDVVRWERTNLAGYRRPKQWLALPELPLTVNGKIARAELAATLASTDN